jgi:dipeptidyl aminopeptidase/acylaminoacyl peptidase
VFAQPLAGKSPKQVSHINDDFTDTVQLGPVERHAITSADGLEIEYFLVRPADRDRDRGRSRSRSRDGRRMPVHLEIHGGPHGFHALGAGLPLYQTLAAAGVAVLLPNPRGSCGYGQAFTEACTHDWGGGDFDDLMACVDDVVERGVADPERLTVGGYSYGGFMTSWVIGHTRRFRAAVVGAPVVDQLSMLGTTDVAGFSIYELGGLPWERPDEYVKRSPLTYLQNATTPVLIQHREGDLRCPIGQSEELYAHLKLLGKKVEFVRYPGGSHFTSTPSQAVDRVQRILDWIRQ